MRPIRAGELRHKVTLQQEISKDDNHGGQVLAWADVATVWAKIEPISGTEAIVARQVQDSLTHKIWLRWRPGVVAKMRLLFGKRVFNIIEPPRNWDERNRMLELRCEEGIAT